MHKIRRVIDQRANLWDCQRKNHPDELIERDFKLIIPREAIQVRLTLEERKHEQFCGNEKIENVN